MLAQLPFFFMRVVVNENVDYHRIRELFPTHSPTHNIRCLVRLPRILAVPAVL
jgi:hypothetical protein